MEYFCASKQLKKLVIGQSYGGWRHALPEFMFPWDQLTHVYIYNRCMSPWTFTEVLPQCISLEEVVIHLGEGISSINLFVAPMKPVTLPYLSNITIQFSDSGNQHIFSNVHLPGLRSLGISSILKQGMRFLDSSRLQFKAAEWTPFYKHLFPLRKLEFTKSCMVTVPDVLEILKATPNVTHFHLTISECSSSGAELIELFEALKARGDKMLLPALTELDIEFRRLGMFGSYEPSEQGDNFLRGLGDVISGVVRSRCPSTSEVLSSESEVYGLRRVEIHSPEEEWKPLVQGVLKELVGRLEVIRQCELEFSAGLHKIGCSPRR
ncbi:hypothetical protein BDQ17DRAFT_1428762 [Cyathus striatus]|nr:hypothetical protein BDQ17DRAFT_1428762 [Cyathus striatus]